jgi:ribosomal protein L32
MVASLCCDSAQAKFASTEPTGQRRSHGSKTLSSPDVIWICAQDRHIKRPHTAVDSFYLLLVQLGGLGELDLTTQHCRTLIPGEVLVVRAMLSEFRAVLCPVST